MLRAVAKVGDGMKRVFEATDSYLDKPYRTRRWLIVVATVIALGLVVYVNIVDHELRGETLIVTLVGGTATLYGGTKIVDSLKKDKLNDTEGDL